MAQFSQPRQPRYSTGKSTRRTRRSKRARSAGPTPARRRGPAPILIIAVVIVGVISCYILGRGCGGSQQAKENDSLRAYTTQVNKLIEREAGVATQFDSLRNGIKEVSKDDANRKLTLMVSDTSEIAKESSSKVKVPARAEKLQPLLQVSFDKHASGLEKYRTGLMDLLDKKDKAAATSAMQNGLMTMVIADQMFQIYRADLEAQLKAAKSGDLGFVQVANSPDFVPKLEDATPPGVANYIAGLVGEDVPAGSELHGVAVKGIQTSPASEDQTESGVSILPFSQSFNVTVTVENQGNQQEDDVPVLVTLTSDSGGTPQQQTKKITRLKPNESSSVVFEGFKPATGNNAVNTLTVKAGPVAKEQKTDNNEKILKFIMRPQG